MPGRRCFTGLSLVAASGSHSSLRCEAFLLRWLLSCRAPSLGHSGCSGCFAEWGQKLMGDDHRPFWQRLQRCSVSFRGDVGSGLHVWGQASVGLAVAVPRLQSSGSIVVAQLLQGVWDLPRSGTESVSPALADSFSTTEPPGKPKRG